MNHDLRLFGKADSSSCFDGLPLAGTKHYSRFAQSRAFALRALSSAAYRRPDHIVSTHVNFGPAAYIARKAFGIPYTLVAHGIDVHPGLSVDTVDAMRAADGIVAVSEWTRLRVLDLGGIDPSIVTVLPNTFDEDRFRPGATPDELRSRYHLNPEERVILTVARLASQERYKGYDRVIRALPAISKHCGPVRFLLIGKGEDRERIEALSALLGIRSMVTLAGFVPDRELASHYRLADVFAMPSTGEGFGIVFLEALGCGTPVVAGNRDGSVDALDGGLLGSLVDPNDIGAIARGIQALLRKEGPSEWFDPEWLHAATVARFGRSAFRAHLRTALLFLQ